MTTAAGTGSVVSVLGIVEDGAGKGVGVCVGAAVALIVDVTARTAVGRGAVWQRVNPTKTKKQSHPCHLYLRISACRNFILLHYSTTTPENFALSQLTLNGRFPI
jgi:hypothetical protein